MITSRSKRLLVTFVLLLFTVSTHAVTLKIATIVPDGTNWMKLMRGGAKEIKQRTDGRVKFKFYPGGVMGSAQSVLRKIRIRQLHGGAFLSTGLSHIYSNIQIYGLPFLFRSFAEVDYVRSRMDHKLMAGLEQQGMVGLGISEGGFGYVMCQEPMRSFDDLRDHKVWIPEGDVITRTVFEEAEINPIPLPIADVYTGLQTGLIDTVANTSMGTIAFQWHTRISHITDVPLIYTVGILAVDKKAFGRLKKEDQQVVREVMLDVFSRMDKINRDDNESARVALLKQGIKYVQLSDKELEKWKETGNRATRRLGENNVYSQQMYLEIKALLTEFRASSEATAGVN